MKKILVLVALVMATGSFAQDRKSREEVAKEVKTEVKEIEIVESNGRTKVNQGSKIEAKEISADRMKGKPATTGNSKGHHQEMHDNGKVHSEYHMSGREFGQKRAEEAKNKPMPETAKDAEKMLEEAKAKNLENVHETEMKIMKGKLQLEEKRNSGELTKAQYEAGMKKLEEYDLRRKQLEEKVVK